MTWFTPAGGAVYHARALFRASQAWSPFRRSLGAWLATWPTPGRSILLVGPSAGYCLEDEFFARFQDISVLDPDPVARFLLGRRFARLGVSEVTFLHDDLLLGGPSADPSGLSTLLERDPARAVLFCNVLGQVRFLLSDDVFEAWSGRFRERVVPALRARAFASFHDRLSGEARPDFSHGADWLSAPGDSVLLEQFYRQASLEARATSLELLDHLTGSLWPAELPRRYFEWETRRGQFHLIEGVRGDPSPPREASSFRDSQ